MLARLGRVLYWAGCGAAAICVFSGYLDSIYDTHKQPPPIPTSISAPVATPESRLSTLKDLLDRKAITQQEDDERRRAILGSL